MVFRIQIQSSNLGYNFWVLQNYVSIRKAYGHKLHDFITNVNQQILA